MDAHSTIVGWTTTTTTTTSFLMQTSTIFFQVYKINIRIFILKNMTNFHVFLWIYYCVGIMFFCISKVMDDLLVGGDEREHQQSIRCKYVGRVGLGLSCCNNHVSLLWKERTTQENTRSNYKIGSLLSCSQNVNCLHVNI